jgi:hypothetical protein
LGLHAAAKKIKKVDKRAILQGESRLALPSAKVGMNPIKAKL